jgi:hypothetical protein
MTAEELIEGEHNISGVKVTQDDDCVVLPCRHSSSVRARASSLEPIDHSVVSVVDVSCTIPAYLTASGVLNVGLRTRSR